MDDTLSSITKTSISSHEEQQLDNHDYNHGNHSRNGNAPRSLNTSRNDNQALQPTEHINGGQTRYQHQEVSIDSELIVSKSREYASSAQQALFKAWFLYGMVTQNRPRTENISLRNLKIWIMTYVTYFWVTI